MESAVLPFTTTQRPCSRAHPDTLILHPAQSPCHQPWPIVTLPQIELVQRTKWRSWLPVMMERPSGIQTMADTSELCAFTTCRQVPASGSQMRSVVSAPAEALGRRQQVASRPASCHGDFQFC